MRTLIVKGNAVKSVNVLAGTSSPEKNAAEELKKYLGIIGVEVSEGCDFKFTLGIDEGIINDGFRVDVCDNEISIIGGNGRGVLYGVYTFLEKYAGMRFFTPTLETYGEGDVIVDEGFEYEPTFELRQADWQCGNDIAWSVKNKINHRYVKLPDEVGGYVRYGIAAHSIGRLCGTDFHSQPCLTDPEMLRRAKASVREVLKNDPNCDIVSVSQNDNQNYCKCERCAAIDAEEGSHMGTLLRFVNEIADDIKDDYPHVVVDTLAYQYTRKPPKITKPRPNVCIRLCSIECCFCHPLSDDTCGKNGPFYTDIVGWNEICNRIYIWDYVTNFRVYIPTFPNLSVLRDNMRFYATHHVRGMYPEGPHNARVSGEFAELKSYLLAKLMWNPYMSAEEYSTHIDEFMKAYYGEGWKYLRAYVDLMESMTKGRHMGIYYKVYEYLDLDKVLTLEETIDGLWDKAEALAGDKIDNVRRSRFQWRFIQAEMHPDAENGRRFYEDCLANNIKWNEYFTVPADQIDFTKSPSHWADATMYRIGD